MMRTSSLLIALVFGVVLGATSAIRVTDVDKIVSDWPSVHFESVEKAVEINPFFSFLRKALKATGLNEVLYDRDLVATIFAPTDVAFKTLLKDLDMTSDELLEDKRLLRQVLKYHVVGGAALKSGDLSDGQVEETLLHQDLTFTKEVYFVVSKITIDSSNPDSRTAMVIIPDVEAGKSVIHMISEVLLPELDNGDDDDDDDSDDDEPYNKAYEPSESR